MTGAANLRNIVMAAMANASVALSIIALEGATQLSTVQVRNAIARLLQRGFAVRSSGTSDVTSTYVLTPAGQAELERCQKQAAAVSARVSMPAGTVQLDGASSAQELAQADGTAAASVAGTADVLLSEEASASVQLAKAAVELLPGEHVMSSKQLALLLDTTPARIDIVLAPLVNARRLTRVDVLRGSEPMFDYRRSLGWKPVPGDFRACIGATEQPVCQISPIAPPKPTKLAPPAPSMMPPRARRQAQAAAPSAPPQVERERVEAGGRTLSQLVHEMVVARDEVLSVAPADQAADSNDAVLDRALERDTPPNVHEAIDFVAAINSRGELAIDIGGGDIVKFPPAQTLRLQHFLANCHFLGATA